MRGKNLANHLITDPPKQAILACIRQLHGDGAGIRTRHHPQYGWNVLEGKDEYLCQLSV